jgi:hypothetical protein
METIMLIGAILVFALLLWIILSGSKKRKKLKKTISDFEAKYRGIIDVDLEIEKKSKEFSISQIEFEKQISDTKESLIKLKEKYQKASEVYEELNHKNDLLKDTLDIAEFGVYEPHFNLDTSEDFKTSIIANYEKQKSLVQKEAAVKCFTNWSVGNSQKQGEIMTKRAIKLTLRAFNGECDSLVAKVKWNNIKQAEERIMKTFDAINNLNKSNDVHIQEEYLNLKLEELRLTHEYELKKNEEKEEQRRIRDQMREEEKAQRDFEKAEKETEKEEKLLQQAMLIAQEQIAKASNEEKQKYETQLAELQAKLKAAEEKHQRAISMAQQTKSGHIYIISNIGSFGENVFKIGMTRRLDPMDRVNELGDASVPFKFDVHAMIYSENAPELENMLHKTFNDKRLNNINLRREYFNITLQEIEDVIEENHGEIDFTRIPEAKEYRESLSIKEQFHKGEKTLVPEPLFPTTNELFDDDDE